jgi:hypothetical protein
MSSTITVASSTTKAVAGVNLNEVIDRKNQKFA